MTHAKKPRYAISCIGCSTTWTGLAACHCSVCHTTFSSITGFDMHRKRRLGEPDDGPVTCRTPQDMKLVYHEQRGVWATPYNGPPREEARVMWAESRDETQENRSRDW